MPFRTTIVGLGRVGSSIGLALRETEADFEIVGHDRDHAAAKRAHKSGSVDRTEWNLINACDGANLVVISTPLPGVRSTLEAIAQDLETDCVVTDTARLKVPVLKWARQFLPPTVHFVGGHPICKPQLPWLRAEETAPEPAEPSSQLFNGAIYCLTPGTATPPEALQTVANLAQAVGAKPYYLDAAEHDGLIAALEGLPLLMAAALQVLASRSPSWREMIRLSGMDFASATEVLAGDAGNLAEQIALNAANNARWVDAFLAELATLRELVVNEDAEALQKLFTGALEARDSWMRQHPEDETVDYSDFNMARMMLGDLFRPPEQRDM
jgi:prephenate dehydrogenase